jgi:diguanylate cyclase (GGDEF)-like protein
LKMVSLSAQLDRLTGLPNRMLFMERFARAIDSARRDNHRVALLFVDLNKFKQINDALGHSAGDVVLQLASRRLVAAVRASDMVSRYGGDEFLIMLTEMSAETDIVALVEKIIDELGQPGMVADHVLHLTASIGVSIFPDDGEDAFTLTDCADAAMYDAKRNGRRAFAFHGSPASSDPPGGTDARLSSPLPALAANGWLPGIAGHNGIERREADRQHGAAVRDARKMQAAAEHAQQRQTELLALVAHELRNPLTPLLAVATLIGTAPADQMPRLQDIIKRQVGHLSHLIHDLLDLSRISTGKLRLERDVVDMHAVIETAVETVRPAMQKRQQRFALLVPATALAVFGDPVRLTQVLSNLLGNASKYTANGGLIELAAALLDDTVVVTVSDNGIGIASDALSRVFEPFVQESHAVGFNSEGLGIGLAVVQELVVAHGGTVVAYSAGAGLGSKFIVTLPRHS